MESKKLIHSNEYHLVDPSVIHEEVKHMTESLGMAAGSVGDFDLYKVISTYFTDMEKRHAINELLHIPEDASFYYEK